MDPKNIERYSRWARPVLEAGMRARMLLLGIAAEGDASRVDAGAASAGGVVLSAEEARMRDALLAELDAKGEDELVRRAAYTWFNRLLALRYLELKGLLPHGRHVLSDASGLGMPPEAVQEPEALNLPTLPREAALRLKAAGDVQATFRAVLMAQSDALAKALPKAFGPEGDPLALLLPDGLLGPEGAVRRLVEDVSVEDLDKPEALGWAYQYWVAEERAAVETDYKDKGRRVTGSEIPAVTQLFTPDWLVDYLVQNSLGRLWVLNNPESSLRDSMPYYVAAQGEKASPLSISSPEEITFCDPACGSGHMMLAAFRLLGAMYEEVGYRRRDIPALVLTNNLSGMEIDPRAAQLAELCLALEACSWDRNFLTKPTDVDITVLQSIFIDPTELPRTCALARNKELLDALAHLSLCGSLLEPSERDIFELKSAIALLQNNLGDEDLKRRLEAALASCESLSRNFIVIVANPPYMGSKKMPAWLNKWVAKRYPTAKRDLCTCFVEHCLNLLMVYGFVGLATSSVWMFLSSYEDLREELLKRSTIDTLVQLSQSGFKGISAQVCALVLANAYSPETRGGFIRLFDFSHYDLQGPKTLEAISNEDCGWFYRRRSIDFLDIPGAPIAYWASDAVMRAFRRGTTVDDFVSPHLGMATSDNNRFVRSWWEVSACRRILPIEFSNVSRKWYPYNKGGIFRKWYGNNETVVNWENDGAEIKAFGRSAVSSKEYFFQRMSSWSRVSSGVLGVRYKGTGFIFDMTGPGIFGDYKTLLFITAYLNSSVALTLARIKSPSQDYQPGQIGSYPCIDGGRHNDSIRSRTEESIELSRADWDSYEISWDFSSSPLIPKKEV